MASTQQGNVNVGQTAAQPTAETTAQQQQFGQPEQQQQQPLKTQPTPQQENQPGVDQQQKQQQQSEQQLTQQQDQTTGEGLNIAALFEPLRALAARDPTNIFTTLLGTDVFDPLSSVGLFDPLSTITGLGLPRLGNVISNNLAQLPRIAPVGAMARLDVGENEREFRVTADVPGVPKENIKLEVDANNRMLHISTSRRERQQEQGEREGWTYHRLERTAGPAHRRVKLPLNVDINNISANVEDGVLIVVIPKVEGAEARKQIPIS